LLQGILEDASEIGTSWIALSGGEPLVYQHLVPVAEKIRDLKMQCAIATSGVFLSKSKLEELDDAGIGYIWISLNGSTEEIHRNSRDGFDHAIRALEHLQNTNINYGINWVARDDNSSDFPNMVELAERYGAREINILRLKPDCDNKTENSLKGDLFFKLADYIRAYHHKTVAIRVESCFSTLRWAVSESKPDGINAGCMAGRSLMAVNVEGNCLPCRHLFHEEKYDGLQKYWDESHVLDMLRKTEENVQHPCIQCDKLPGCRTCRAVCEKLFGDFHAGEKDCGLFTRQ
jgi:pyrroloquinoline quinone biosynthesis protein E